MINTIVGAFVALLAVLFAVSNRMPVTVEVWPFPWQLELPLYALILLAGLLGFICGAVALWMSGGERRKEQRRLKKQVRAMEESLAQHKAVSGLRSPPL